MIPNQWYVVLDSSQIRDKPVGVTRMGEKLVFWRDEQGKVNCLSDRCVHRGVSLSGGKIVNNHLQCPFHGFEYDVSGRVVFIPANGKASPVPKAFKVKQYPVHEEKDFIWIWWGQAPPENLEPPHFFDDIQDYLSYGKVYDPWKAHYSRVIENQLDVVHLPFIHYNTIGRGGRTLVDGPVVKWAGDDMFFLYVQNRVDDGSLPLKPDELYFDEEPEFKLEFIFPNLWQNYISKNVRVVAAFVPVDAENTILYLRFYQGFMRIPLFRELINWIAMPLNVYIAHQDRKVVETHEPKASGLRIGEVLIRGDHPIIEYRKHRANLMKRAETAWINRPPAEQEDPLELA